MYNKTNQNVTANTVNITIRINDIALASAEAFNKSIKFAQKFDFDVVQSYYNYIMNINKLSDR